MTPPLTVAADSLGSPALNITVFGAFVAITLYIVYRVSHRNTSTADYYAAGSAFTGAQNGVALTGDYLSAASFLGIAGAIAVHGYDGFLYSIGFLVAWLVALLLVAELRAQHRPLHDGRRARLPDAPASGPRRGRHVDARDLVLLHARPDGRRRRARRAAAQRARQARAGAGDLGRRPDHDHLRARRRHEGHHLGADHQGVDAPALRRADDRVPARQVRVQRHGAARRGRGEQRPGSGDPRARRAVRQDRDQPARLHLALARADPRRGRPAARADALLHRAQRHPGPPLGRLGGLGDVGVLPGHAGDRVRRVGAGRVGRDPRVVRQGELGRAAARLPDRRHDAARHRRRGGVRDDPRGGRRPDDHRVGVLRARRVRQHHPPRQGRAGRRGPGRPAARRS